MTSLHGEKPDNAGDEKVFIAEAVAAAYIVHISPFPLRCFAIIFQ